MPVRPKTAHVITGLPALGKTYFRAKLLKTLSNAFVYSTDDVIEFAALNNKRGMTFNDLLDTATVPATKLCTKNLNQAIKEERSLVVDNLNLASGARREMVKWFKTEGYATIVCHYFFPPMPTEVRDMQEWLFRRKFLLQCGRGVSDGTMKAMERCNYEPSLDEGYSSLHGYNLWGREISRKGRSIWAGY
jgi:hypothetical protein